MLKNSLIHLPHSDRGFTLIEMLIVLSIIGILAPLTFLVYSSASAALTMRQFTEDIRETIAGAQMTAITEAQTIKIVFDSGRDRYQVIKHLESENRVMDPRIDISGNIYENSIIINKLGHFLKSGTILFTLNQIRYKLVIYLGQGRYYFERVDW